MLPQALRAGIGETQDLAGRWVTPALVDCHTHLIYAGTRAAEFAARIRGVSYEEISRRGGGIASTMKATRAASEQQLFEESAPRLESLLAEGVGTVEIKSGYGLTLADERKMLRVARRLGEAYPVTVKTTFLGAHAVPPEFKGRSDDYIDLLAREWLPALHAEKLVDAVDIFCENIAFSAAQSGRLFDAAGKLGLPVKMHAEQLSNIGGSALAAKHGIQVIDYADEASGLMEWGDGTYHFTKVVLEPVVTVAKGTDLAKARALHEEAHAACFIARSVNFPVTNDPVLIESLE